LADDIARCAADTRVVTKKAKSLERDPGVRLTRRIRSRGRRTAAGEAQRPEVLARLQQLWTLPEDLLCVIGDDGRIKMVNPAWRRTLGWSDGDLIGSDPIDLVEPEDAQAIRGTLRAARRVGRLERLEIRCRHADGSHRWLSWSGHRATGEWYVIARDVTALKTAKSELAHREGHSRALLRALSDGLCVVDGAGRIREVSERFCEMTGLAEHELIGAVPPYAFWPPEELDFIGRSFQATPRPPAGHHELTFQRKNGERFPVWIEVSPLSERNGDEEPGFLAVVRDASREIRERQNLRQDITDRKRAEREIRLQAHLLDAVDVAVVATDLDGMVTHWNRGAQRTYGWASEETIGRSLAELTVAPEDGTRVTEIITGLRETGAWEGELTVLRKDGSRFPAYIRDVLFSDSDGEPAGLVGVSVDISERVESERQMQGARDYLRTITDSMGDGLFTLDTDGRLIYLNPAGEELLGWRQHELIGQVMHEATRHRHADGSPLSLMEFPLVLPRIEGQVVHVDDDVFIRRDGSELPVEITAAPFRTEEGVRGSVVVFSDISERKTKERQLRERIEASSCVAGIRDALAEDRFLLYAQPIIDLSTGKTVQHELLLRLRERSGAIIAPQEFLPAAEESGLILDIDGWVVRQAIALASAGHRVELNLSAHSLSSPGLIDDFREQLERTSADPSLIVVELTETALLANERAGELFIERLEALGCKLALDDFGTGYGGFTYLKRLPVNFLKIDIEFVRDLLTNQASQHVVKAIVTLAQGFGQKTVAEGVENEATLRMLRDFGVDWGQGYGIARPKPVTQVLAQR
jgi:PAS domain S-box-containing protein